MAVSMAASARVVRPSARPALPAAAGVRSIALPVRPARLVRAKAAEPDPTVQLQETVSKYTAIVQEKWEATEDSEKPAAVAIILGSIIAQIAIGATIDAVHKIPLVSGFLEFVGLGVVAVYGYRYVTDPTERESVKMAIDSFVSEVTGKKPVKE